mgnify:CR=1 FL=1
MIVSSKHRIPWFGALAGMASALLFTIASTKLIKLAFFEIDNSVSNLYNPLFIGGLYSVAFVLTYVSNVETQLRILNGKIEFGTKYMFRQELKGPQVIDKQNVKFFRVRKRSDKFYEIIAERKDGFKLMLYEFPNRLPAEGKFESLLNHELKDWKN